MSSINEHLVNEVLKVVNQSKAHEVMAYHHKIQCGGYLLGISYDENPDENYIQCSCGFRVYFCMDGV